MIGITDDRITVSERGKFTWIGWPEIRKLTMWKCLDFGADLVCCTIDYERFGIMKMFTVNEEMKGFDDLDQAFGSRLSGYNTNWRLSVILPLHENNVTVVYLKQETVY